MCGGQLSRAGQLGCRQGQDAVPGVQNIRRVSYLILHYVSFRSGRQSSREKVCDRQLSRV